MLACLFLPVWMALHKVCQADPFARFHTRRMNLPSLLGLNVRGWDTDIVGLLQEVKEMSLDGAVFGHELVIRFDEFSLSAVDEKVALHPPLLNLVQIVIQVSCLRGQLFLF